ncbi:MAG: hypothetical protein ACLU7D_04490 [Collinsella sp.]
MKRSSLKQADITPTPSCLTERHRSRRRPGVTIQEGAGCGLCDQDQRLDMFIVALAAFAIFGPFMKQRSSTASFSWTPRAGVPTGNATSEPCCKAGDET